LGKKEEIPEVSYLSLFLKDVMDATSFLALFYLTLPDDDDENEMRSHDAAHNEVSREGFLHQMMTRK